MNLKITQGQQLLKILSNQELIDGLRELVLRERKIAIPILNYINEVEERKLYLELGYDGIYAFLTKGLGYSEGNAYRRIQSARLVQEVPELEKKIEEGSLNLTQITELHRALKSQGKDDLIRHLPKISEVIEKLENKTLIETQKILAVEMNLPIQTHEKIKPQRDDSIRLEITLNRDQFAELEQSKSLLSHVCPEGKWAEVISTLAKNFNKRRLEGKSASKADDTARPHSDDARLWDSTEKAEGKTKSKSRVYLSVHTKRKLLERAQQCCEYRSPTTGQRCSSRYQLEIEHIIPVSWGGGNEIENLRVYCRAHNALTAEQLGIKRF